MHMFLPTELYIINCRPKISAAILTPLLAFYVAVSSRRCCADYTGARLSGDDIFIEWSDLPLRRAGAAGTHGRQVVEEWRPGQDEYMLMYVPKVSSVVSMPSIYYIIKTTNNERWRLIVLTPMA
jgi:hypothetical protein